MVTVSEQSQVTQSKRIDIAAMLALQAELAKRPCTYADLRAVSGLGRDAVFRWVKRMRAVRAMHLCGWSLDARGRQFVPMFKLGAGDDAPRPGQRRTPAERMAALRAARAQAISTLQVTE